jgi:hypothetical protein
MLPPISDPTPIGEHREDIKAAYPPELPPAPLNLFQGFKTLPHKKLQL